MKKTKKNTKPSDSVSSKEVTLNSEISNNINLNVSQSDLIDMAIQEKKEQMEAKLITLNDERKIMENELREEKALLIKTIFSKELLFSVLGRMYLAILAMLDKAATPNFYADYNENTNETDNVLLETNIVYISENDLQELINSSTSYKLNFSKKYLNKHSIVAVEFKRVDETTKIQCNDGSGYSNNKIPGIDAMIVVHRKDCPKKFDQFDSRLKVIAQAYFDKEKAFYDQLIEYKQFRTSGKKVRARLTRLALSKSDEGKKILNLLSQNSTKLLGC